MKARPTSEQYAILFGQYSKAKRLIIEGRAGTGKSICAWIKAINLATLYPKEQVLYLCWTAPFTIYKKLNFLA